MWVKIVFNLNLIYLNSRMPYVHCDWDLFMCVAADNSITVETVVRYSATNVPTSRWCCLHRQSLYESVTVVTLCCWNAVLPTDQTPFVLVLRHWLLTFAALLSWAPAENFSDRGKASTPTFITFNRLLFPYYFSTFVHSSRIWRWRRKVRCRSCNQQVASSTPSRALPR